MAHEGDMDIPELVDDEEMDENDYDVEGIGWDDDDDDDVDLLLGPVKCLFCDRILNSAKEVFSHSQSDHSFHVLRFCGRWSLDCLGYIKLINFIRSQRLSPDTLNGLHPGRCAAPWDDDKYMAPVDPEDLLLQFDIESEDCSAGEVSELSPHSGEASGSSAQTDQEVVIRASDLQALIRQKDEAQARASVLETELQRALHDLECIRKTANGLIAGEGPVWVPQKKYNVGDGGDDGEDGGDAASGLGAIQRLTLKEDESYFSGYADFNIHAEMLQDKVRTESYRDFMLGNPEAFADKVVLDVGCGTGILSMFAAKAGAKHVIGVDMSEIVYRAMDIARENGLQDKITFLRGRMEDVKLPYDKVDIIISEWMGYFLLFESMLDTVIVARNEYLTPGGCVYPDKCSIWLAGFSDDKLMHKIFHYWDDVYGFKMSCMKTEVLNQTAVDVMSGDCLITEPCRIKEMDINKCSLTDVDFSSEFSMVCSKDGELQGILGYFDIGFETGCSKPVYFSTGPGTPSTHWKQTQFLLKTPIKVTKGTKLEGSIEVKKYKKDPRSLDIKITLNGKTQEYVME